MSHAGITGNCATCHLPAGSTTVFAGIARIVGMPPTSPAGANAHIPAGTACETLPPGQRARGPGGGVGHEDRARHRLRHAGADRRADPQRHPGGGLQRLPRGQPVGWVWGAYPDRALDAGPGASYKGFQTRPRTAAGA